MSPKTLVPSTMPKMIGIVLNLEQKREKRVSNMIIALDDVKDKREQCWMLIDHQMSYFDIIFSLPSLPTNANGLSIGSLCIHSIIIKLNWNCSVLLFFSLLDGGVGRGQ